MLTHLLTRKRLIVMLWTGAICSVVGLALSTPPAWDCTVYWNAIKSVRLGVDPYTSGIAVQKAFRDMQNKDPQLHAPWTYVYSPVTLPMLRVLSTIPAWLFGSIYGCLVLLGFGLQLWAGTQLATEKEWKWLIVLLPVVGFFPGLIANDVILSGNLAYPLYGMIMAAMIRGWHRNQWIWFYLAVFIASLYKAPMLSLLAIPVLIGKRQFLPASIAGMLGCTSFFIQQHLWPQLFREYLEAVQLQFDWNHDFGFGPAGILGNWLVLHGHRYKETTTVMYLAFALAICITLLWTAIRVRHNRYLLRDWFPIAFVGTILLNPRIKEYDAAVMTIPLLLICFRTHEQLRSQSSASQKQIVRSTLSAHTVISGNTAAVFLIGLVLALTLANVATAFVDWKPIELAVILVVFVLGTWTINSELSSIQTDEPRSKYQMPVFAAVELPSTEH